MQVRALCDWHAPDGQQRLTAGKIYEATEKNGYFDITDDSGLVGVFFYKKHFEPYAESSLAESSLQEKLKEPALPVEAWARPRVGIDYLAINATLSGRPKGKRS